MAAVEILPWHWAAWQRFSAAQSESRLAHALLIHGAGGLHKRLLAEQMAAALLCSSPDEDTRACGHCRQCSLFAAGNHPDYAPVTLEDSAVIKIDQIRALSARLSMRPQMAQRQVALIVPAERMNTAAANALLKTLEEPAADTHLLLLAERPGQLPATIRSRCQAMPLSLLGLGQHADVIAARSGTSIEASRAALALAAGDPEAAEALLTDGQFERAEQLAGQLLQLAQQRLDPLTFAASVGKSADGVLLLWSRLLGFAQRAQPLGNNALDALIGLTSRAEMSRLCAWMGRLERARRHLGSGLREDLLVLDLANRWANLLAMRA